MERPEPGFGAVTGPGLDPELGVEPLTLPLPLMEPLPRLSAFNPLSPANHDAPAEPAAIVAAVAASVCAEPLSEPMPVAMSPCRYLLTSATVGVDDCGGAVKDVWPFALFTYTVCPSEFLAVVQPPCAGDVGLGLRKPASQFCIAALAMLFPL